MAYEDLSKTIELDAKLELAFYYRAIVLNSLGRPIDALDDLNNLIEINSNISLAYYEREKLNLD